MKKYILKMLIMLAIFVVLSFNMTVFATFCDIDNHWAEENIQNFVQKGYISSGDSNFYPDSEITKGELSKIVNYYFSYGNNESIEENLKLAESKGYLSNAKSEDKITREEVAILICKILSLATVDDIEKSFVDDEQISGWAKGYVNALVNKNIVVGYPDMTYKPQKNITKAEFVTILNRCVGVGGVDLELIDKDISGIEIGIFEYKEGKSYIMPISDEISLDSGDSLVLALMLSEEIEEDDIIIAVKNNEIVEFDTELYTLSALKDGQTQITFKTKDENENVTLNIKVN